MGDVLYLGKNPPVFFRIIPYSITRYTGTVSLISLTLVLQWSYIGKEDRGVPFHRELSSFVRRRA
jgi:hypothetical protein